MKSPIIIGGLNNSGKTSFICTLLQIGAKRNISGAGFKPFDKGLLKRNAIDEPGDGVKFCRFMKGEPMETLVSPYCAHEDYPLEMSLRRDGIGISWNIISQRLTLLKENYDRVFVELPSSLLTSVTEESMIIDWLNELKAEIIWIIHPRQDQFHQNLHEVKLLKEAGLQFTIVFNNATLPKDQDLLFYIWEKTESFSELEAAGMIPYIQNLDISSQSMVDKFHQFLPGLVEALLPTK